MTVESDLEIIAQQLATFAKGDNVNFKDRLDSFKALTSYHFHKGNPKKNSKNEDDDDEQEENFHAFRDRVEAASSGNGEDHPTEPTD